MKKIFNKRNLFLLLGMIGAYLLFGLAKNLYKEYQWKKYVARLKNTASDQVQVLKDTIEIDYLDEKRTLYVYLPPGYDTDSIHYPVLYFFDGESLFNEKVLQGDEWQVDEVLDSLSEIDGQMAIVIGIQSSDKSRLTEYKPFTSPYLPDEKEVTGDKHAEWIVTDLKAWVDGNYRTKPEREFTCIGGASLGGLMSYYMITQFPDVFSRAFVFSPSFWVNEKVFELHKDIKDFQDLKIYINSGELEVPIVENSKKMYDLLIDNGMTNENLKFDIEDEEGHWHMTWRKGFRKAYPWILD